MSKTIIAALLRTLRSAASYASSSIAVHCSTGLGSTGTIIALWLMRTARQV
jgi:protein-tyrosine phosphatase